MTLPATVQKPLKLIGVGICYVIAGKLGLTLAFVHASATAVWPPTGIAIAALLLLGLNAWPAIFAGAFLVNLTTAGTVLTSAGIATGNTLEAVVGAAFVMRWGNGDRVYTRPRDIALFALLAAGVSTTIAASVGVTTLSAAGFAPWTKFSAIWFTWWLGDASGALVVAPVLLLWAAPGHLRWTRRLTIEMALFAVCLLVVGELVFGGLVGGGWSHDPLEFLCIPLLLWAAFRFTPRDAATAVVILAAVAIRGTVHGHGPFVRPDANESLLLLQSFMGVTSLTTLTVAAIVARRRRAERWFRALSMKDALTGLGNYRQLEEALERELVRSQRTGRPFAVLLFDLDRLKLINDRYGHLTGSRALVRVAEVLKGTARGMDTAARYGGDEFAVILPETEEGAAQRVAHRVAAAVAASRELPPISVSAGIAIYPRDGLVIETLLEQADRALYGDKVKHTGR
ncbi:MAG TPA: MASE1 domain-containing protein [Gemmatimonadales bacterium]|nr:MASE1 domain-containing protein [Gemmatimonadales bacterium]